VPCWVRELDDDAAYMLLATSNAQSELTALERGLHALHATEKGKWQDSVLSYAKSVGRPERSVRNEVHAAEVLDTVPGEFADVGELSARFSQLVEIHAAPQWLWPALVKARRCCGR
jgi:hypothetical protein